MPQQEHGISISDIPSLQDIAREVSRTRKRCRIPVDDEDVIIVIEPKRTPRSPSRARPLTQDDALFALIGIGKTGVPSDASEHKHEALDEGYRRMHSS